MYVMCLEYVHSSNSYISLCTYVDQPPPVIETVTITSGRGYVSVTWTAIKYGIVTFTVTLLSPASMNMTITTPNNYYNFTGLLDDTQYDVTVFGTNMCRMSNVYSNSVKTVMGFESMYIRNYI